MKIKLMIISYAYHSRISKNTKAHCTVDNQTLNNTYIAVKSEARL